MGCLVAKDREGRVGFDTLDYPVISCAPPNRGSAEETEPTRKLYLAVHEIVFDIVLGFRHPDLRPFTEYAAAGA